MPDDDAEATAAEPPTATEEVKVQIYKSLADELKSTVTEQLKSKEIIEGKGVQMISLNLLLAGFFLSSIIVTERQRFIIYVAVALLAFTYSILQTIFAYAPSSMSFGLEYGSLEHVESQDIREESKHYREVADAYEKMIEGNDETIEEKAAHVRNSMWASLTGILVLTASLYRLAFPDLSLVDEMTPISEVTPFWDDLLLVGTILLVMVVLNQRFARLDEE